MTTQQLVSVGIDIGTTTSQLVFSRLSVTNQHRAGLVPRLDIESREVIFQTEPQITPLRAPDVIDVEAILTMVRGWYDQAGIRPAQVETGAVIITGETARTKNAEMLLDGLGDLAGDFVVTVAGPNLESQIAGRGSGAAAWSAKNYATVVNVDIGGGSSNAAMFRNGEHVASTAAMVGGRQAVLEAGTGKLLHLAPTGQLIADQLGLNLRIGQVPQVDQLRQLTDAMAEIIVDLCLGQQGRFSAAAALSDPFQISGKVGAFFISGGVGLLYYSNAPAETIEQIAAHGDVGPLLAKSLRDNPRWQQLRVEEPVQTLRATVLGAASQQISMSGSTIWAEKRHLPIRSAPVIEPRLDQNAPGLTDADQISNALRDAVQRWDRGEDQEGDFAISIRLAEALNFAKMKTLADGVLDFVSTQLRPDQPLILVIDRDYAQVLGQTIKQQRPDLSLIVIDQVELGEGDFIDIGEPMFDGRVVPVSVKTLVFYQPDQNQTRPKK